MTTAIPPASRNRTIAPWILRSLMEALLLFAGFMKLTGKLDMVSEFDAIGFGR